MASTSSPRFTPASHDLPDNQIDTNTESRPTSWWPLVWIAVAVLLFLSHYWTYSVGLEFGMDLGHDRCVELHGGDR
jgi:hypothetical protein